MPGLAPDCILLLMEQPTPRYRTFGAFYPFYLTEHVNPVSRRLHVVGTGLVIACLLAAVAVNWRFVILAPIVGYGFAWAGHLFFEKNRPATFKHPLYSFAGDWVMYKDILVGKIPF